jgi:biotin carboxyl carrier protein
MGMSNLAVTLDDKLWRVNVDTAPREENAWTLQVEGETLSVRVPFANTAVEQIEWMIVNNHPYEIIFDPELRWVQTRGRTHQVNVRDLDAAVTRPHSRDGRIKAPIPGQITRVFVEAGQTVEAGAPMMILEAMKMENHLLAPVRGIVSSVNVAPGARVNLNQVLAEIHAESD